MFPAKEDFTNYLEENGIYFNAWTGGPDIHIFLKFPDERLEQGLIVLNEVLFNVSFAEGKLGTEKKVVGREYADKWSKPENRFEREISRQIFGKDHIYTRDGVGVIDYVNGSGVSDLKNFYSNTFLPENILIGFAGNLSRDQVEKTFGEKSEGHEEKLSFGKLTSGDKYLLHEESGLQSASVVTTWLTAGFEGTDKRQRVMSSLMCSILGGGGKSILFKKIRDEMGLAYSISASHIYYPTVGVFQISTKVANENIDKLMDEVKKTLGELDQEITADKFIRAKQYQKWQRVMAYDSPAGVAERMSNQLLWEGKTFSLEEELQMLETIGREEMIELIRSIVDSDEPYVSIMKSE